MLSRRNVRTKVMQLLYARRLDEALTPERTLRAYRSMIDQSYATLLFDLYTFVRVLAEARGERERKQARLRPSEADLAFREHAVDNPRIAALQRSPELLAVAKDRDFDALLDDERLRGFYEVARGVEGYDEFATAPEPSDKQTLQVLLRMHKALMDHEGYNDYLEDRFARWQEDKSLVVGSAKKVLKALPQAAAVLSTYRPDEETRTGFGESLLDYVLNHDDQLLAHIEPVLENWDADRVATVDLILLKMALAELIQFPQIPPKVSLNEYVELAKTYSTDKSSEFVNGVLDRLLHTLRDAGVIVKEGRGLVE